MGRFSVLGVILLGVAILSLSRVRAASTPSVTVNGMELKVAYMTTSTQATVAENQSIPAVTAPVVPGPVVQAPKPQYMVANPTQPVVTEVSQPMLWTPPPSILGPQGATVPAGPGDTAPLPSLMPVLEPGTPPDNPGSLAPTTGNPTAPDQGRPFRDELPVRPQPKYAVVMPRPDYRYNSPGLNFLPRNSYTTGQIGMGVGPGLQLGTVRYVPLGEF